MKNTFLPKTRAGKLSAGLFIAFIALAVAGVLISSIRGNAIEYPNPLNSPLLGTVIYLMFSAAILASITGLVAIKNNERSVLVYISIPLGIIFFVVIVVFLIANLTGPPGGKYF